MNFVKVLAFIGYCFFIYRQLQPIWQGPFCRHEKRFFEGCMAPVFSRKGGRNFTCGKFLAFFTLIF